MILLMLVPLGISLAGGTVGIVAEADGCEPPGLVVSNPSLSLTVHPRGGALTGLSHRGKVVNPFSWSVKREEMPPNNREGAPFRGHFICLNRWGAPTPGEQARGIPHNGEASNRTWKVNDSGAGSLSMEVVAPLEEFRIGREVTMDPVHPVILVRESYTNLASFARPFMLVQHGTFGRPFIDRDVLTDSNAGKGFFQKDSRPDPEEKAIMWPAGGEANLRSSDHLKSLVATHIIPDTSGWCTVASPAHGFLVGYIWDAGLFPWLHVWHAVKEGEPAARGIEFGNTGLGDNYPLAERYRKTTFNRPHHQLLDASETLACCFHLFTADLPAGFLGVTAVELSDGNMIIRMKTNQGPYEVRYRALQL